MIEKRLEPTTITTDKDRCTGQAGAVHITMNQAELNTIVAKRAYARHTYVRYNIASSKAAEPIIVNITASPVSLKYAS